MAALISALLGAEALLLEGEQRLGECRVATCDLFAQDVDLRVLAAEREHGGAGDVGMHDVAGEQAAQCTGVLARAAAAAVVGEEADAVEVGERSASRRAATRSSRATRRSSGFASLVAPHQFAHGLGDAVRAAPYPSSRSNASCSARTLRFSQNTSGSTSQRLRVPTRPSARW